MSNDISSISSLYSSANTASLTSATGSTASTASLSGAGSAVSVDISKPGQLWRQLQALAQSDPSQFKEVTAEIASQLKDAASSQTGNQADFLNNLADRFQTASQSGNFADLVPSQGQAQAQPGAHHHHHHHAQSVDSSSSSAPTSTSTSSTTGSMFQLVQKIISQALQGTSA